MKISYARMLMVSFVAAFGGIFPYALGQEAAQDEIPFTRHFFLKDCRLVPHGTNPYFLPLQPGRFLSFKGKDDGKDITLLITVLDRTKVVNGVRCAVVREKEWTDGELTEISFNYFAICRDCHDVFYFGEDVDIYENGKVVNHDGAWLAGKNGAKPGLLMPGRPLNGARYFQEIAPGVALDQAEHHDDRMTVETPAGTFKNCLFVVETTPLEPGHLSLKYYARGVGLIQDGVVKLIDFGSKPNPPDP